MSAPFEIVLLGTGSPLPSANRFGSGLVAIAGDARLLFDCGWGAARRLWAGGIPPASVGDVFFTHLHSDHITDLPDFMVARWTTGAKTPLNVYGPRGTEAMVQGFLAALAEDTRFRLAHHGDKLAPEGMRCIVREIAETDDVTPVATLGGLAVGAFAVDHRPVKPALGFRIELEGQSVVISGDTKACDALVRAAKGADVLVCEAMNVTMLRAVIQRQRDAGNEFAASMLEDTVDYHALTVAPTGDVASMARDAGVKHVVLTHLVPPPPDEGPLVDLFVAGMSDVYGGQITVGRDLLRIAVGAAVEAASA